MPEPPFLLTPNKIDQRATLDELVQEVSRLSQSTQLLMDEIFNERIGGANLGDVFEIGNDDILAIRLKDDDGLRKVDSELALKLSAVGGMQVSSNGLQIKIKTDGGLQTDIDGLSFTGTITFNNTGLKIKDINDSHVLTIQPTSDLTANRTLSIATGDSARAITLDGNPTLNDWFDQAIKQASIPTFDGLNINTTGRIIAGSKALSDGSATGLFEVAIPSNTSVGGTVSYSIKCFDGTDLQNHSGLISFAGVNKAGTVTSDIDEVYLAASETAELTAGTLSDSWTITDGAGKITINLNANTSLTPTSFVVDYVLTLNGNEVVTKL